MSRVRYTAAQRRAGVALVRQGLSIRRAAIETGVTSRTMRAWCRSLGVESTKVAARYSEIGKQCAAEMGAAGMADADIARQLGLPEATARVWAHPAPPKPVGSPGRKPSHPEIVEMIKQGMPTKALCAATGLERSTVQYWRRKVAGGVP